MHEHVAKCMVEYNGYIDIWMDGQMDGWMDG